MMKAKEAMTERVTLSSPRQLGPMIRMPRSRARSVTRCCKARPSSSTSAKPALKMMAARTPSSAHSSSTPSTSAAGTLTIARSTSPGTSSTLG
jgi:hypothetical protein